MYIAYDTKNGTEYAKLYTSHRDGDDSYKDYQNLGRVIDKEHGIYMSRARGIFTYDLDTDTYGKAPEEVVPPPRSRRKESLIVDFGDTYFLDRFTTGNGFRHAINAIGYGNPDTLYSMICYYALNSLSNCYAWDWWEGNYARILYPKANLTSQRISDFLEAIGEERSQRAFFGAYLPYLQGIGLNTENVAIDSTGLPNSIRFPLTAISNHNGDINNEARLIYIVQQNTGMPVYSGIARETLSTRRRWLDALRNSGNRESTQNLRCWTRATIPTQTSVRYSTLRSRSFMTYSRLSALFRSRSDKISYCG